MIVENLTKKNFFITGATGFLAKIVVEKLLRSIPDIGKIYLLIRTKRNQTPQDRLNKLMSSRVFNRLRSEKKRCGEFLSTHLIAIAGDVGEERLGMSDEDLELIQNEVNVFIHSAATIEFNEPLNVALKLNVLGTLNLFKIAKKAKNLEAFTHISTAYTNCIKKGRIDEK
eukprot:TRINITY_DN8857_c1_g1_i1.p1 TRINITY_DN8857_c1_g1~~TRINITY_DN8857_c1_g1_i1.p1  ORF type:complete len:170 (-),score=52.38 TRINITY_DN8857_c1_g1_i1:112-621(-)